MQEEGKKTDLLKNDFDSLDIGSFRIKKKKKVVDANNANKKDKSKANLDFMNQNVKYLKVDEMNVIKIYNDIIEESSADDKYFQIVRSIISIANRSLVSIFSILGQFLTSGLD
jgi:hypothetical protein